MSSTTAVAETALRLASPLPPLPDDANDLTPTRWKIFAAIADTVVPAFTPGHANRLLEHPLRPEIFEAAVKRIEGIAGDGNGNGNSGNNGLAARFLCESATAQPEFKESVRRLLRFHIDDASKLNLCRVLDFLNTRAGSLLLTGYVTTIDALPVRTREEILKKWSTSHLPPLRDIFNSLTLLAKIFWLRTSPTLGRILDYPEIPSPRTTPTFSFPFEFLQFPPSSLQQQEQAEEPETLTADVIIIGSGCGGAVTAATLSEAGMRVIVVDKSYFWAPEHLPMSERDAAVQLFDNGGLVQSDDGKVGIIAGSTWGGGGTINWSASLQPQGYVRREWAQKFGLGFFLSSGFQRDLDAVCDRMGVASSAIEHNRTNSSLLDGARKLGWSAKVVPQNTAGHTHSDGYCTLGCWSGAKQGPTSTFLPDAAKAGARFIEGLDVTEIMFEEGNGTNPSAPKTVKGIKGTWTSRDSQNGVEGLDRTRRELVIKAPRVIVSAGTLRTPVLLQRSGLKNWHIGRHLHLHPVSFVGAVWDEDVKPWEGSILTSVVTEFENQDGQGYGAKLEAMTMLPGWFLVSFPWTSGLEWKEFAAKMKRSTGYISLARDRYGGTILPDPQDPSRAPRVHYVPSSTDRKHILAGVVGLAQLAYVEGAREIHTAIPGATPFVRQSAEDTMEAGAMADDDKPSISDPAFAAWIDGLKKMGLGSKDAGFASAHQMGSCRMGTSEKNSAVDPRGRVWGTEGLWVADASVFPSASGVNPMVTTMGVARGIARGIVEDWNREGEVERAGFVTGRARL